MICEMANEPLHIGEKIKAIAQERGVSATELAKRVPCDLSNIYSVYHREDISVQLLIRIAQILDYDFFHDLSEALPQYAEESGLNYGTI